MTATPIPRTLAMTYYADLDVSMIDELPPGRTPMLTKRVADARRDEVIERVHEAARRAAGLLGLPADRGKRDAAAADGHRHPRHAVAALPELRVGLVHGRLAPAEKAAVMDAFTRNEVRCWWPPP